MKSETRKVHLTDDLIREAVKLELDSVDVSFPSEAWKRIEAELAQSRVTSAKRPFSWSTTAAAAAVFLVLAIGGMGLFRSMQSGIQVADSEIPPAAGEEIALLQVEDDLVEDSMGIMEENGNRVTEELPSITAEAEPETKYEALPPLLSEDYLLSSTVFFDLENYPSISGAYYRSIDVELLFARADSSEMPVAGFLELLGSAIGAELEVIEQSDRYIYFKTLEMPGLAWQDENQNQALMVVYGSLDLAILKNIASGIK